MLEKTDKNYAPLHMNRTFNASKRMESKMMARSNWYKSKKNIETDMGTDS